VNFGSAVTLTGIGRVLRSEQMVQAEQWGHRLAPGYIVPSPGITFKGLLTICYGVKAIS